MRSFVAMSYPSIYWALCIPKFTGQVGINAQGGVWMGGVYPQHALEADTLLWTEWLTDMCKNITFRATSFEDSNTWVVPY